MTDFTLPTQEELDDELRSIGVHIDAALDPANGDTAANHYLRAISAIDVEIQRLDCAEAQARALAAIHYERQRRPLAERRAQLEAVVLAIATGADFGGKKKSRALPYGEYGRRASAETIQITEPAMAVAWCAAHGHEELIQRETIIREKLPHAAAKGPLLDHIHETGEIPDGIELVPAKDEPYCKPAPAVLAAEQGAATETI